MMVHSLPMGTLTIPYPISISFQIIHYPLFINYISIIVCHIDVGLLFVRYHYIQIIDQFVSLILSLIIIL